MKEDNAESRMCKEERRAAECAVKQLGDAIKEISAAHHNMETLIDNHGWDFDLWEVSGCVMKLAEQMRQIVMCIATDDGWEVY